MKKIFRVEIFYKDGLSIEYLFSGYIKEEHEVLFMPEEKWKMELELTDKGRKGRKKIIY